MATSKTTKKNNTAKAADEVTFYTSIGQMTGFEKKFCLMLKFEDGRVQRIDFSKDEAARIVEHWAFETKSSKNLNEK